jgi:hypothetical protein
VKNSQRKQTVLKILLDVDAQRLKPEEALEKIEEIYYTQDTQPSGPGRYCDRGAGD